MPSKLTEQRIHHKERAMNPAINVGAKVVGHGHPCFVVAEIGINHNGNVEIAKKLIDVAVSAGCDAVKFQKRTVDVVYTPEELAVPREHPFGKTNGDLKRHLEFGFDAYAEIDRYCKKKGILWTASPWDEGSVDFLEQFEVPFYKVASASLTDDNLLHHIHSKGKPVMISTGMSTIEEVEHALSILGREDTVILHTISTYPAADEDLNLRVIETYRQKFPNIPIGYSGHEKGIHAVIAALVLGACVIERHITLDFTMFGSDQAASLQPDGLRRMVRDIRSTELSLGNGKKDIHPKEVPIKKKLRRVG